MTNAGDGRQTKNQRREAARQRASELRARQKRKERRGKWLLQGGILLGIVAIVAVVAFAIVSTVRPAAPGPRNMLSDGIVLTSTTTAVETPALAAGEEPEPAAAQEGALQVQVYLDYLCPFCGQFEQTNAEQIAALLDSGSAAATEGETATPAPSESPASGAITYEIHPIAILDSQSLGTSYSTRAANAAACVADSSPSSFWAFNEALFANQPEERTVGLTDAELTDLALGVSPADPDAVETCIAEGTFEDWVGDATARARNGGVPGTDIPVSGTPTIVVNGAQFTGALDDPAAFASFLSQQAGQPPAQTPTPTPTPSASETPAG
jgi:protein-disulfide isomerase